MQHQLLRGLATGIVFLSSASFATNGYFTHGVSAQEKGLAGAAVAMGNSPLSVANNPASLLNSEASTEIGFALFSPDRYYASNGAASKHYASEAEFTFSFGDGREKVESDNSLYAIPQIAYASKIDDVSSWGIAAYGQGGMNTEYTSGSAFLGPSEMPGMYGGGDAGVDLMQLFIPITYARLFGEKHHFGISIIGVLQAFEAKGLQAFSGFSTDPQNLTNKGHDKSFGIGYKLGYQYAISDSLTLGASLRPEISMGEFDDYAGLFAKVGSFDIPANYQLGFAWNAGGGTISYEFEKIAYSDIDSVGNSINVLFTGCMMGQPQYCLGGSKGAGFGFSDMQVNKIGYERKIANGMVYRVGFSNTKQPISKSQIVFGLLAPAVIEKHYTFSLSIPHKNGNKFGLSFLYAPSVSQSGSNPLDPAQKLKTAMKEYEIGLIYTF